MPGWCRVDSVVLRLLIVVLPVVLPVLLLRVLTAVV